MLCWLALLLLRVPELERLHLGEFLHKDGRILQYSEPAQAQRNILKKNENIYTKKSEVLHRDPLNAPNPVGTTPFLGLLYPFIDRCLGIP
jgi:hypothetical protein